MATWFISRHPGAKAWAKSLYDTWAKQDLTIDHFVEHLKPAEIQTGDTVIGNLPVHMAWAVCEKGATFLFLALDIPQHLRGAELSCTDMCRCNARLEHYTITKHPSPFT